MRTELGQIISSLKWDLFVIGLIVAVVWIFTTTSTIEISPVVSEEISGSRPPDRSEGDILLLLPDSPAPVARNLDELDCSYQWFNALWQHFGSFATLKMSDLSPDVLAGRAVVIIPSRVSAVMPANGVSVLSSFVRKGGQVIVEQPTEVWGSLTSLKMTGNSKPVQQITSVEGMELSGPMRRHLPYVPLYGNLLEVAPLATYPKGPVLIEVDQQPGFVVNPLGKGLIYTSLFDIGCTLTALQQGRPIDGMSFDVEHSETLPTASRTSHIERDNTRVPYADLLERAVFSRLEVLRPIPRLSPFPAQKSGIFIMIHPVSTQLRAGLGFADAANQLEGVSTLFVPADLLTTRESAIAQNAKADIGLNWIRGIRRPLIAKYTGLGPLKLRRPELTLTEQFSEINLAMPVNKPLRAGHVEEALFINDWATTLKQIAASRLQLDSSFGPNTRDQYGYLFGTGYPFYPLDEQGLLLPMLELPYLMHGAGVTLNRLRILLEQSSSFFQQVVTISIPAESMRFDPNASTLLAFQQSFDLARKHDHWIATTSELMDFLSARRATVLTSRWDQARRMLDISVNLMGARSTTLETGAFPGISIPARVNHGAIGRILVDGENMPLTSLKAVGSGEEYTLSLSPGRHDILIQYEQSTAAGS